MRIHRLDREMVVARPRDEVFAFFSDPFNLEAITPPWLRFRIESMSTPTIEEGTEIHYRLRIRGVPVRWTSRITLWDPPHAFVDEQVRGPYRLWRHFHSFEPRGAETVVGDEVRYAPLGGWFADRLLVRRELDRIFDHRRDRLAALLGSPAGRARVAVA